MTVHESSTSANLMLVLIAIIAIMAASFVFWMLRDQFRSLHEGMSKIDRLKKMQTREYVTSKSVEEHFPSTMVGVELYTVCENFCEKITNYVYYKRKPMYKFS